jgi:hypothetical protein
MDIVGVPVLILNIFARLSPRDYAQMRPLDKKICAYISGKYARILWKHETYQDFVRMFSYWKPHHVKEAAKWFWNIGQYIKMDRVYLDRTIQHCMEENLFNGWTGWNTRYQPHYILTTELIFALIENLCTSEEVLQCNSSVMGWGFEYGIILNLLRKRKYDVIGYFKKYGGQNIEKWQKLLRRAYPASFDFEEVLEYCISKNTDLPNILMDKSVFGRMGNGGWNWKEVVDDCIEFKGGESVIRDIAESTQSNCNLKDAIENYNKYKY